MSIYQVQIGDDNANDADHQDDHHQTKEVKGDAYTEGRRARAVGHSARHRFLIIIYIIYTRPDTVISFPRQSFLPKARQRSRHKDYNADANRY